MSQQGPQDVTAAILSIIQELSETEKLRRSADADGVDFPAPGAKEQSLQNELSRLLNTLSMLNLREKNIDEIGAQILATALVKNRTLKDVNLKKNNIGDVGAQAVAGALKHHPSLAELDIENNNIGLIGARAIADALTSNKVLRYLELGENNIGAEGGEAIAVALRNNNHLRYLSLWRCKIGDAGAKALADTLRINWGQGLVILSLGTNQISSKGFEALATALKRNENLKSLYLYYNSGGDEGARAFASACRINQTLEKLKFSDNNMSENIVEDFIEMLPFNSSLTEVDFGSELSEGNKQRLKDLLVDKRRFELRKFFTQLGGTLKDTTELPLVLTKLIASYLTNSWTFQDSLTLAFNPNNPIPATQAVSCEARPKEKCLAYSLEDELSHLSIKERDKEASNDEISEFEALWREVNSSPSILSSGAALVFSFLNVGTTYFNSYFGQSSGPRSAEEIRETRMQKLYKRH